MDLQKDDSVTVLTPKNEWSTFPCKVVEKLSDNSERSFYRLEFPNGEIKRVFHDRIKPFALRNQIDKEQPRSEVIVPPQPKKAKASPPQPKPPKIEESMSKPAANAAATTPPAQASAESEALFDPWAKCPQGEVFVKENDFNASTVCKTVVILEKEGDKYGSKYFSVNTYNGRDRGMCEYDLKDAKKLIHRLTKKNYKAISKSDWK